MVVSKLIQWMKERGWQGRPLLAVEVPNEQHRALTGTHRITAARIVRLREIPVFVVSADHIAEAAAKAGITSKEIVDTLMDCVGDVQRLVMLQTYGLTEAAAFVQDEIDANASDFESKLFIAA